ncbi:MAG: ribonuclease P protein component [Verrucomicrobiae bacterium]|nr:ribonuclease P protein component [Verrucomicrobiae bacterium]
MSATPGSRWRLGRRHRLRAGRDFVRLKAGGHRVVQGCLIFNWLPAGPGPDRIGLVAGRSVGGAVVRNRAKRLLREAFRRHRPEFAQSVDAVLVARKSIAGRGYAEVERDFLKALRHARLLKGAVTLEAASRPHPEPAA